jgi:hypothetical protein
LSGMNRTVRTSHRRCFLGALKGLISRWKSQITDFSVLCFKNVAYVLMGLTLPKNSAQMTHRAAAHVPIRHLPPGQLRPDGAYRDQGLLL